jgi:hypothetical protein
MQQGAEGLWTATSPVLAPEIYSYHFVIDGTSFLDPRNTHVVNNLLNLASDVTIPATPPEPWELQGVPHGVVERHFYTSQVVQGLPNNQSDYYTSTRRRGTTQNLIRAIPCCIFSTVVATQPMP